MRRWIIALAVALWALACGPLAAQQLSGGSSSPCTAFGTTTGTCLQGAGALGTPASGTATNLTGLPISTGVSGLGTGVATLLGGTPSGTGGPAGTNSPTFTTPNINVATGTSLALGGATIGTNALAVNGILSLTDNTHPITFVRSTVSSFASLAIQGDGTTILNLQNFDGGITVANGGYLGIGGSLSTPDVRLYRDASGIIACRNSTTNSCSARFYNTFTDASNYERLGINWTSNVAYIRPENAGTGSARLFVPVTSATTVSGLPAAATAGAGGRSAVTDATTCVFNTTPTGGGSTFCPVVSTGSAWTAG